MPGNSGGQEVPQGNKRYAASFTTAACCMPPITQHNPKDTELHESRAYRSSSGGSSRGSTAISSVPPASTVAAIAGTVAARGIIAPGSGRCGCTLVVPRSAVARRGAVVTAGCRPALLLRPPAAATLRVIGGLLGAPARGGSTLGEGRGRRRK